MSTPLLYSRCQSLKTGHLVSSLDLRRSVNVNTIISLSITQRKGYLGSTLAFQESVNVTIIVSLTGNRTPDLNSGSQDSRMFSLVFYYQ